MSSTNNPITLLARKQRTVTAVGGVALGLCSLWALWPQPSRPVLAIPLVLPEDNTDAPLVDRPLDRRAFAAAIWNPAATTTQATQRMQPERHPPVKVRLELIGIAHDTDAKNNTVLRAVLYDPVADMLHIVAAGERVGVFTVEAVKRDSVDLLANTRSATLWLSDEDRNRGHNG